METLPEPRRSTARVLITWLRDLALSLLIAAVVILFIYQPVQVEGTSMMPALADQERVFISKLAYRLGIERIERGDTVVFWFPGDRVRIAEGVVYVNGRRIEEKYVPEDYRDRQSTPETTVTPDAYFVLGDHRSSSSDSRNWGLVPRASIYGKAVFVYWPIEKIGPVR